MTTFQTVLADAQANGDILGLILVGSRGKGFENAYSDHDAILIAKDAAAAALRVRYADAADMDLTVCTLAQFEAYAAWDSAMAWDRYNFAHVKLLVDRTGTLPALIAAKGKIPDDKRAAFIDAAIDAYVNGCYRAVKCIRAANRLGAHLEAANAMRDLIVLTFALNGRHSPFLGYLEKELTLYPLEHIPLLPADFTAAIETVLQTADLQTQQTLLIATEKLCRTLGHGRMFDTWNGKDKWAMTYNP